MDVFFMIFGFFVVFLCITVMYFGLKKSSSHHPYPRSDFESELEKALKKKEVFQKNTSIEQRIETVNKAEQQLNFKLYQNSEKRKWDLEDPFSKRQDIMEESVDVFALGKDAEKKNLMSRSGHKSQSEEHRNKGKIKAHRSSRSLVTVGKEKDDLLFQTIEKMELEGLTMNEIAKKLGRGVREIEIIKRLNEKS